MPFRNHLPLDPACPDVRRFYDAVADDPMSQACGCMDEIVEAFEHRHRAACVRCRAYGCENIEVVD